RIYAEDPTRSFLPQAGPLLRYREPAGPGLRVDSGVSEGGAVSVYYDPMLAKLIAYGETRAHSVARAREALTRFEILGLRTNLAFLDALLARPEFAAGQIDTGFIDRHLEELSRNDAPVPPAVIAAAAWHASRGGAAPTSHDGVVAAAATDPFDTIRNWRG
ncbi:MAG: 3-methylcrotonyl-CoA carboxylase, partial [Acidobacteriota bacterium]